MAYTYTCTGVADEITALKVMESHIEITFKVHGFHKVSRFMKPEVFSSLKKMEVGQKVLVATLRGQLMWVKTE